MFKVTVTTRGKTSQVTCNAPVCLIGKSDENLVVLQGWAVQRKHAAILRQDDQLFVREEGGAPTLLNGLRVSGVQGPLAPGDVVEIGAYKISAEMVRGDSMPTATREAVQMTTSGGAGAARAIAESAREPAAAANAARSATPESNGTGPRLGGDAKQIFSTLRLIHERVIARLDFRRIDVTKFGETELRNKTRELIEEIIEEDPSIVGKLSRDMLVEAAVNEAVGLGPLESLLADDTVSEIMVNRYDQIFVERAGKLQESEIVFSSDQAVQSAIERIVAPLGRRIDESSPMVDGRLKDGSRVNAVIPPLSLKGPSLTIRKFSKRKLVSQDMVNYGSATMDMMDFLKLAVEQRKNVLISGGTGSGKTTLLNILSNFIPGDERVVTVEDAAELKLSQPNLVSLEARPANVEGKGLVSIRDLVRNCLRMRPDRIVVGECRGGEALDMLQAMNTGHDGSLTTVHANAPRDTLARLEVMVLMAGMDLPVAAIRQQIASAIDLIVQQQRMSDGSRKITHISEVTGMENGVIQLQDLFLFKQHGYDDDHKIRGEYTPTGRIPEFYEDLAARGIDVDRSVFFRKEESRG
ncbi:MAG: Flp pilus assembly complex ATPase component TadA [Metallibacterium scheffleri]|jgi:pilus assembly protein CpaF|uniref:ATPase, T2SS/T4P/T4SS family n=1 Tax=Metallibacterium scheffleri TaxID=993689 RepID=UPI0026F14D8E|nr:ATPase, T2SS/T4P/T4SS family [Metallibacterium scheffleri]MCK9366887.1 Flp pilus assembly complex ATPase component TadA [Metallibacterium scheffleri]